MQAEKVDKNKTNNGTAKTTDVTAAPVQPAVAEVVANSTGPGVTSVAAEAAPLVTAESASIPTTSAAASNDRFKLVPTGTWPPPIYVDPNATEQERHYIEHRWYAQWEWYDKKASEAKRNHQRTQMLVLIGSTLITALVAFTPPSSLEAALPWLPDTIRVVTVIISIGVGVYTGLENQVFKYGDNWRSFRGAAEELLREKALYDVRSGPYRKTKTAFLLFVQRCEEIMTKQNGSFLQLAEEVQQGQGSQQSKNNSDDHPLM